MVSLLILSMGLLGLIALQGLGTQYGNKSYFQTQAMLQSYDIIDRMRANLTAAAHGAYAKQPVPANYTADCSQTNCSPMELADYDLVSWNTQNANLLPEGAGFIKRDGALFTVQVSWREGGDADDPGVHKNLRLDARL